MTQSIQCARCGASEDASSASMSEQGLVCASCHLAIVEGDASQMRVAVESARAPFGEAPAGSSGPGLAGRHAAPSESTESAALIARGAKVERSGVSSSTTSPLGTSSSSGFRERWTLPAEAPIQARFAAEELRHKLVKLFKREVQTGDSTFDALVYVETSTPERTRAFLDQPTVREHIGYIVSRGGSITVEGAVVEVEALWSDDDAEARHEDLGARFVLALLDATL